MIRKKTKDALRRALSRCKHRVGTLGVARGRKKSNADASAHLSCLAKEKIQRRREADYTKFEKEHKKSEQCHAKSNAVAVTSKKEKYFNPKQSTFAV